MLLLTIKAGPVHSFVALQRLSLLACFALFLAGAPATAQIAFEEATAQAGIDYVGPSWGAAWGDYNGDGLPDVWVSNHGEKPNLYVNQGNGQFVNVARDIWSLARQDTHGAGWADIDNDGDEDLIELQDGGSRNHSNRLYLNDSGNGILEVAQFTGLDAPFIRGRTPLWFDWDNDGLLDLFVPSSKRQSDPVGGTTLFRQVRTAGAMPFFEHANSLVGLSLTGSVDFGVLSDFNGDGQLDLHVHDGSRFPLEIFDTTSVPFVDLTDDTPVTATHSTLDAAVADFTGDLIPDIYIVRGEASGFQQVGDRYIGAQISSPNGVETGLEIHTPGDLIVTFGSPWKFANLGFELFSGPGDPIPVGGTLFFSASDPTNWGIEDHVPGIERGVFFGYDPIEEVWTVLLSSLRTTLHFEMTSNSDIAQVNALGFDPNQEPPPDRFLVGGDGFSDATAGSGIQGASWGRGVAAGDFDNDGDQDVFIVAAGAAGNRENVVYENLGDGQFQLVPAGAGAGGAVMGHGDATAIADYDGDGFLDLFVTNGKSPPPFDQSGPSQLFRNLGNDNHWIEIDLEGVQSNRNGIGATVHLTADGTQQIREQNAGVHYRAQNHQRLHFGLGSARYADRIHVRWPSGIEQEIERLPSDSIVRIIEASHPSPKDAPSEAQKAQGGVFLWKETLDGPYHVRVTGVGTDPDYTIRILADQAFDAVSTVDLSGGTALESTPNYVAIAGSPTGAEHGFDFVLPAGARALVSVLRDDRPNPRHLRLGATAEPLAPSGWVLDPQELGEIPDFDPGVDLGLFVGTDASGDAFLGRWNGDGRVHKMELSLFSSEILTGASPVRFESTGDAFAAEPFAVDAQGLVNVGWDGVHVPLDPTPWLALTYLQDGIFQPHRVNPTSGGLGHPNASSLPGNDAEGEADFDSGQQANLFLWRDGDVWKFRAAAGGARARYTGRLRASQPPTRLTPIGLEASDVLEANSANEVVFDFVMANRAIDGFDVEFPVGTEVFLDLGDNGASQAQRIRVGEQAWPIEALPLELTGR